MTSVTTAFGVDTPEKAATEETEAAKEAPAAEGDKVIDFAVISDLHGHIENAASLAFEINKMRKANADTHLISAGDNVGGSAYVSAVAKDEPTIEILKAMKLEVSAAGNHEFDQGAKDLAERIVPHFGDIPILAANAEGGNEAFKKDYVIKDYNGVKVAYIGTVTQGMPALVSPLAIEGITFKDPVETTNRIAEQLKDGKAENGEADVVVALMHEDLAYVKKLNKYVDLGFGGHSHNGQKDATASGAAVCEPWNYGQSKTKDGDKSIENYSFVKAQIKIGADKKVTSSCDIVNVPKPTKQVPNKKNPKVMDTVLDTEHPNQDQAIKALYDEAAAKAKELGSAPVGYLSGDAKRATTGKDENRGTESPANNLIAEAFYQYGQTMNTKPAFGIMNAGGVRTDFIYKANTTDNPKDEDGLLTVGESNSVQPFGNAYAMIDLTGEQVYTMLEQQWKAEGSRRPVLNLGLSANVKYVFNPEAEQGKRILAVYVDDKLVPRDASTTYTIASNNFLLVGGDDFPVFKEGKNFIDTGVIDNAAFNKYVEKFQKDNPLKVDYTQRSFGVVMPKDVKPGETFTVKLSGLSHTSDEPKPETVTISIDGLGEWNAKVDTTPEATPIDGTGKAEVSITLPATTKAGKYALKIATKGGEGSDSTIVYTDAITVPGADEAGTTPDGQDGKTDAGKGGKTDAGKDGKTDADKNTKGKQLAKTGADGITTGLAGAMILLLVGVTMVASRKRT